MKKSNLEFFLGRTIQNVRWLYRTYINPYTGIRSEESTQITYSTREALSVKFPYINLDFSSVFSNKSYKPNTQVTIFNIYEYDKNMKYLGYTSLSGIENLEKQLLVLKKNTAFIEFTIRASSYCDRDLIENQIDFIYEGYFCNPCYKSLSKKYAKQSEQEFFRETLEGSVKLYGPDFDFIYKTSIESKFKFIIKKDNAPFFIGSFAKGACKFEVDKKQVTPTITAHDEYTKIINNYENTQDLLKIGVATERVYLHNRPLMQVYVAGADKITNFLGGAYWENDVDEQVDDEDLLDKKYHFVYCHTGSEFELSGLLSFSEGANLVFAGMDNEAYISNGSKYTVKFIKKYEKDKHWGLDYTSPIANPKIINFYDVKEGKWLYAGTATNNLVTHNFYYLQILDSNEQVIGSTELLQKPFYFCNSENESLIYFPASLAKFDIYDVKANKEVKLNIKNAIVYRIFRRLLCNVDSINSIPTNDIPAEDFSGSNTNRNYKKCIGLTGGLFFCSALTTKTPTKYGKNDYGEYFTNNFISSTLGLGRAMPISRNSWANTSLWYVYSSDYAIWESKLRKKYALKDAYPIESVISSLLKKVDPSIRHEGKEEYSSFLYSNRVPFKVFITQKTNILKGSYDQAAQKAETSLKDILDMLALCFNCYWYIEDKMLKIEHLQYFRNGLSYDGNTKVLIDLTKRQDAFNKKNILFFQSSLSYNASDLNSSYEFAWADDVTDLFGNFTLKINSNYVQPDKNEDITASNFVSDVDLMLSHPDKFGEEGFALLCPIVANNNYELPIIRVDNIISEEDNREYTVYVQNWYASWLYLVPSFYKYIFPASQIQPNTLRAYTEPFISNSMSLSLNFPIEGLINPNFGINTTYGLGQIDTLSINIDTNMAETTILYQPK